MSNFQLGVLIFVLSSSFLFGQKGEINYAQIFQNSSEILDIGGSPELKQDCLNLLKKDNLNWEARSQTNSILFNNNLLQMSEVKKYWRLIEKYSLHKECYSLNNFIYSFRLINKHIEISPYLLLYYREIDFFKSECDSLNKKYDTKFQIKLRALGENPDLKKYQLLIDGYHKKHNKLPTIHDIGHSEIYQYYRTFLLSEEKFIRKYIDEIKLLEKDRLFASSYLAKLEDRLLFLNDKPSKYGTIVIEEGQAPYPIEDIQNLNNRRIKMGLCYFGSTDSYLLDLLTHYKIK